MINSRSLDDLLPRTAAKARHFADECKAAGIDIIFTSTYRDNESQNALYAQGRTKPGAVVTKVQGGHSYHNHRVAFDIVPIVNGKAMWEDHALWSQVGLIGTLCDLEWGGNWERWKDKPHFQDTEGYTIQDYVKGLAK